MNERSTEPPARPGLAGKPAAPGLAAEVRASALLIAIAVLTGVGLAVLARILLPAGY